MVYCIFGRRYLPLLVVVVIACTFAIPSLAATTELHIVRYANDRTTILAEKILTYQEMRDTLPVMGDGVTHYYHQGPVFIDNPDEAVEQALRWNPKEDTNTVPDKDMGAVKGTDVRDLCNLVGGMMAGDTLVIKASDGMTKEFAYKNVYTPPARQGPMVITWYCSGGTFSSCSGPYPDSGYNDGMRLVFFADNSVNPWGEHVFGNFDWHESADPQYWYYYQNGDEKYPTTTGLAVKYVSEILIYSSLPPTSGPGGSWGWGSGIHTPPSGAVPAGNGIQYGYKGSKFTTIASGTLNGTVRLLFDPNSTAVVLNNRFREFFIPLEIPTGCNLTLARLYVYVSKSQGIQSDKGVIPSLITSFNHEQLIPEKVYIDTDGDDQRTVSATYAYNVLHDILENGTYGVSLRNLDYDQYVFTVESVMLLIAYEQENGLSTQYWIGEGCDVIFCDPKKGILPEDTITSITFSGTVNSSETSSAELLLISTNMDAVNTTEHMVKFNNRTLYNPFDHLSEGNLLRIPVTPWLNASGNSVSIGSTIRRVESDYIVNRNAILVIVQNQSTGTYIESYPQSLTPDTQIIVNSSIPLNTSPASDSSPTCRLSIHSNPEGALIFIDKKYLGKTTPFTFEVNSSDQLKIRLELDGYLPAERILTVTNDTTFCEYLHSNIYSTKGRSDELVQERDKTRHGGLYVNSRPRPAIIFIDGVQMPQRTPAVIYGLKEDTYTVRLSFEQMASSRRENEEIAFEDREVSVHPYYIVLSDTAAHHYPLREIIIDSGDLRGEPFTVNGRAFQKTIPDKIRSSEFDTFVTIFHNQSYISYNLPVSLKEDHYFWLEQRQHHDLTVFVDSSPRGAEVFIDGFRTGYSTPFTFFNVSDGVHRIMVSKPGYIPQDSIITLLYTQVPITTTNVSFNLEEYPSGFLRVVSDPTGATISLDGKDTGEVTPFIFSSVPIGLHSVTVSADNVTRYYPDITVNALDMVTIHADFHKIPD